MSKNLNTTVQKFQNQIKKELVLKNLNTLRQFSFQNLKSQSLVLIGVKF